MQGDSKNNNTPIFIISGGKGIAGHTLVHSLLIQYPDNNIPIRVIPNIQNQNRLLNEESYHRRYCP